MIVPDDARGWVRTHRASASVVIVLVALLAQAGVLNPATAVATTSPVTLRSHPMIPAPAPTGGAATTNLGWSSINWSGYAVTGGMGAFTAVTGCWTVPTVVAGSGDTYSSSWIGVDGDGNDFLIQTGTEQDEHEGSASYSAWWEILPSPATPITSMTITPGNLMCAGITEGAPSSWIIGLSDETTGVNFSATKAYSGPGESAEWIVERPEVCDPSCELSTLADYGQTTFDPVSFNHVNPDLTAEDGGSMEEEGGGPTISIPSDPNSGRDGFTVAYGSSQPSAPTAQLTPAVTSVAPSSGPTSGDQSVLINGSGFEPGASAEFGEAQATSVAFVSTSQLTAVTPPGFPGGVGVTVTDPDAQSGSSSATYSYVPPAPEPGWVGYQGLGGGPLGGQPHAISWGPGNLEAFWRGTDEGLWYMWYSNGRWYGPESLGGAGTMASDPYPVSWGVGDLDVFWEGKDGNLWHVWYLNGWHGPQSLGGGPLGSAPQPVSWGPGQIDVFWKGTDGNLWHTWYLNGWYGPQSLGSGPLLSTPHPVSWGVGNIDVFWQGPGDALYHDWYANGWMGPQDLGGAATVASDPEPISWGAGNIEVFWKGADGDLWQDYFANGWQGISVLGGGPLGSNPVPASSGVGLLNVFWEGSDGGLWEAYYRNGWSVGAPMSVGTIGSPPSAATWSGQLDVFWEGTDKNLWRDYGG